MKLGFLSIMVGSLLLAGACNDTHEGDTAVVGDEAEVSEGSGGVMMVDTSGSKVVFQGNGVGKNHRGSFRVSEGQLTVQNDSITGGRFVIDINSMDLEEEGDAIDNKLRPHLLSDDFFSAEKYPSAEFVITSVTPYEPTENDSSMVNANYLVSGNLKLRDQTKNVSFPAKIDVDDNDVTAKADFLINRNDWSMAYGNDKSLGDKFISETVNIELDLKAEKAEDTTAGL